MKDGKPKTLDEMRRMGGEARMKQLRTKKQRQAFAALGGKGRLGWRKNK